MLCPPPKRLQFNDDQLSWSRLDFIRLADLEQVQAFVQSGYDYAQRTDAAGGAARGVAPRGAGRVLKAQDPLLLGEHGRRRTAAGSLPLRHPCEEFWRPMHAPCCRAACRRLFRAHAGRHAQGPRAAGARGAGVGPAPHAGLHRRLAPLLCASAADGALLYSSLLNESHAPSPPPVHAFDARADPM